MYDCVPTDTYKQHGGHVNSVFNANPMLTGMCIPVRYYMTVHTYVDVLYMYINDLMHAIGWIPLSASDLMGQIKWHQKQLQTGNLYTFSSCTYVRSYIGGLE